MFFPILLISFILVPVLEIAFLIRVGAAIGAGTTILIVIFTAILGAYLVRQQGFSTIRAVQEEVNAGRVPAMQMAEGIALLFAGAVLLTPGFFTDALGFALLTPPLRRGLIQWVINNANIQVHSAHAAYPPRQPQSRPDQGRSNVIEGEFSEPD